MSGGGWWADLNACAKALERIAVALEQLAKQRDPFSAVQEPGPLTQCAHGFVRPRECRVCFPK